MSAPTIVDSPIETKPLVNPEWVVVRSGHSCLYFASPLAECLAAQVDGDSFAAWPPDEDQKVLFFGHRNGRSLDECKAACEQALRDAGYRFAGDAPPCSNPACDCGDMRPDDRITLPDADGIEVLPDGAKQSKLAERCDLLPPRAVLAVARVMHEGATKYGDHNWLTIPASSHLNHAVRHVLLYLSGDRQEKHLEHAACRALMALDKYLRDADAQP